MHCVVAWNVVATGATGREVNEALRECLRGYSWVRPLPSFYIVQIADEYVWAVIRASLVEVARAHPKAVNIVVSPAMEGGTYAGWLPKKLWPAIRGRVE